MRTWIFQANPTKYRIEDSLQAEREEYWNLNQHSGQVSIGDRVLVWISGPESGIYATGTVLTAPAMMPDTSKGLSYWHDKVTGSRVKPRVLVRYDRVLVKRPLLKAYLEADPELWNLRILSFPRGTNFAVTEAQWQALEVWLN